MRRPPPSRRRADLDGPEHPRLKAALLMIAVAILIALLGVMSTFGSR